MGYQGGCGWGGCGGGGGGGYNPPPAVSPESYLQRRLRGVDAENYTAAGLMLYRQGQDGIELLIPHERPWNSWTNAYDSLGWSVFGGKRIPRQEYSAEATAARCFLEIVGRVEGAPDQETVYSLLNDSFALWYHTGKFAVMVAKVPDYDSLSELPDRFFESQKDSTREEYDLLPMGIKKWNKQIEALEWVPASRLVPDPDFETTNLFENILKVDSFRAFLEGNLDPSVLPESDPSGENFVPRGDRGGKGKGSGYRWKGGKDRGGGKHMQGGYGGCCKGMPMYGGGKGGMPGMMPAGVQLLPTIPSGGAPGPCMGGLQAPYAMQPAPQFKEMTPPPEPQQPQGQGYLPKSCSFEGAGNQSEEVQRQTYGEQLYMLVQPLAPSPYLAQKITGMLLELPLNELMLNLTNQDELYRRVGEALDVLREDGIVS